MASLLQRCDQWLDQSLAAIHQQRTDQQVLEQAQSGLQKRTRGRNFREALFVSGFDFHHVLLQEHFVG